MLSHVDIVLFLTNESSLDVTNASFLSAVTFGQAFSEAFGTPAGYHVGSLKRKM